MSEVAPAQAKEQRAEPGTGLYVHVPFCARTCDYCAFYQIAPRATDIRAYLEGMAREWALVEPPRRIDTVFWGGGTPGLLAPDDLRRLGELCRQSWAGQHEGPVEWTVEMAPVTVTEARLAVLRDLGVNRISLGIQSFRPDLLDALGRQHTVEQVYRAFARLRAAGFANVNLDLMFALPGQAEEVWLADLAEAVRLQPEHLSTYCLTFEEDTKLWLQLSRGQVRRSPEQEAALYRATWQQLAAAGYAQYEVSNFARPGRACIHNLNTWRMGTWIGLGPSAASQSPTWRGSNVADLRTWQEDVARGQRAQVEGRRLSPALLAEDALIFGLRMNVGVDVAPWQQAAPQADWRAWRELSARLVAEGLLVAHGSTVRLTERGRLVADAVGAEIVGLVSGQ